MSSSEISVSSAGTKSLHQILSDRAKLMISLNYDLSDDINAAQTETDLRTHQANKRVVAAYNHKLEVISNFFKALIPAFEFGHKTITAADSFFTPIGSFHNPLHEISVTHFEGTRQSDGIAAQAERDHAEALTKSIDKTHEIMERMRRADETTVQNHWETILQIARQKS